MPRICAAEIDNFLRPHMKALRWAWIAVMVIFSLPPIINHFTAGEENNKDYDIWYKTGRIVLDGRDIHPEDDRSITYEFEFLYPPATATLLAPFTIAGKLPFIIFCVIMNSVAWWWCAVLSLRLVLGSSWESRPLASIVPVILTGWYVCDTYLLGQPNLLLLLCFLGAFGCLQRNREWTAGALVAVAAVIKAFPILAMGYLLYRRNWKAALSTVACATFLLVLVPAPFRGFDRNLHELNQWRLGMLNYDTGTIAQRPGITYGWKNQSLVATANRLMRKLPADFRKPYFGEDQDKMVPIYANVVKASFTTINITILTLIAVFGFSYMAIMPPPAERTRKTNTIEFGMLLILMIIASPISWFYYGVWLMYPMTLVVAHATDPDVSPRNRKKAGLWMGGCFVMFTFIFKWGVLRYVRAIGFPFFGYTLLYGELMWMMQEARKEAAENAGRSQLLESESMPIRLAA